MSRDPELREQRKILSDLAVVAGTPEGRRMLKRFIDSSGMMQPAIVPDLPQSSHFNMGMASMGQMLWSELLLCSPDALTWMITERAKELHIIPEEGEDDE